MNHYKSSVGCATKLNALSLQSFDTLGLEWVVTDTNKSVVTAVSNVLIPNICYCSLHK